MIYIRLKFEARMLRDSEAILRELTKVRQEKAVAIGVMLTAAKTVKNLFGRDDQLQAQLKAVVNKEVQDSLSNEFVTRLDGVIASCRSAIAAESSSSSGEQSSSSSEQQSSPGSVADEEDQSQESGSWDGSNSENGSKKGSESQVSNYSEAMINAFGADSPVSDVSDSPERGRKRRARVVNREDSSPESPESDVSGSRKRGRPWLHEKP
jgi:hypothetical protein